MNIIKTVLSLFFSLVSVVVFADGYKVKGIVVDSLGVGETYATLRIYIDTDTVKPVIVGVTDIDGQFQQTIKSAGKFRLNIHSVGKQNIDIPFAVSTSSPIVDLGTLRTHETSTTLSEVEVVAQRPLVSREIDRIGYDVQADEDSKTSTVIEMLRKVPMVNVDGENKITVRGSSNFKIYKNGRPNNTFTNNPKEVLSSIPASMIKRIEVITEPGAKYDAEGVGAIINIITNDDTVIKGVMGNVGMYSTTTNPVPKPNMWLSSQIDKVTFSINAAYNHMSSKETQHSSETTYKYKESGSELNTMSKGNNPGDLMWVSTEASYELDSLNLFTAEFGGYYYDVNAKGEQTTLMSDANGDMISSYSSRYNYPSYRYFDFNGNLNYQRLTRRKGEAITLSYMLSTTNQAREQYQSYYDMVNAPMNYSENISDFDLNFIEHTFQADWTRPLNKNNTIDVGAKYILRDNNSKTNQEYVGVSSLHSDFSHITNVAALYADYRLNIGKWGARAGMRYEYSHLKADYKDGSNPDFSSNLNDWVPSASLSWKPNDINSFTLNYATRINRPGISYLNPAVEEYPFSTSQGNPDLSSTRHNSVKFSYMFIKPKLNFNISAGYEFSDNVITTYQYVEEDHIYSTYGNIGDRRSLNFSAYMQWTIAPKTSFMMNVNVSHNRYDNNAIGANLSRWTLQGYSQISQQLPWKLKLTLSLYGMSGNVSDAYSYGEITKGALQHSISLRRTFLKEDRLSVALMINNPFNSSGEYQYHTVNGDYVGLTKNKMYNYRTAGLTVSYRFGSLNAQVKKTAKSIENDDLIGRKKE